MSKLPILCGDRDNSPRPCPHTECRYHLATVKDPRGRKSTIVRDESVTCSLDVADEGAHTLEEVGAIVGLTRERVRQIQEKALKKLRAVARRFDFDLDDIIAPPRHALDVGRKGGREARLAEYRVRWAEKQKAAKA